MKRIAVIGAGVSGLTVAQQLSHKPENEVIVYEKESQPGGLIRCQDVQGNLFHTCGGHVFNSKRQDVLDWFWNRFDQGTEFRKTDRYSVVHMRDELVVPYPIENHIYCFDQSIQEAFYKDLDEIEVEQKKRQPQNFEDFLRLRFGQTLYDCYFQPYNHKVWRRPLNTVPLTWLEGKLPMPTVEEMRYNNQHHIEEKQFVHATFYYEKEKGSQFLANRLAEGLTIRYNSPISSIQTEKDGILVNGERFDKVVFCGNIKQLVSILEGVDVTEFVQPVEALESHGTTAVFCEIDKNPYTWIYLPSDQYKAHRIICTGNFSPKNNAPSLATNRITATVEFTDEIIKEDILRNLQAMPYHPTYITHYYNQYTYPIQDNGTRAMIQQLKKRLAPEGIYFTGRFADWEYYNMDVAMGAAIDLTRSFFDIV